MSPQAVSKGIKALERELGVALFDGAKGSSEPTIVCASLLGHMSRVLSDVDAIKALASASQTPCSMPDRLSVGVGCTLYGGEVLSRQDLNGLVAAFPSTHFDITYMSYGSCVLRALKGDFDLILVGGDPRESGLIAYPLGVREVGVVVGEDSSLLGLDEVSLSDVCLLPIAKPRDLGCFYDDLLSACSARGLPVPRFVNGPVTRKDVESFLSSGGVFFAVDDPLVWEELPDSAVMKSVSLDVPDISICMLCREPSNDVALSWQLAVSRYISSLFVERTL